MAQIASIPAAIAASTSGKRKTRYSVADQVKDTMNAWIKSGGTKEFDTSIFPFFQPSLFAPTQNTYVTIVGNFDQQKLLQIQDLARITEEKQVFVFLITNTTRGQMKQLDDGRIINLLSQEVQMVAKDVRAFAIHKKELWAAEPYPVNDRLAYEPRLVWAPTTDPVAAELLAGYLANSEILNNQKEK